MLYICVANSVKTQIQVDIDGIATDLNGKLDKSGGTVTGNIYIGGYPLCSIKKSSFTKSGVSGGDHTSVAITTPSGYTAIPVRVATVGWVGSPYVAGFNNSNVEVYWTHSGSGSVIVDVLFYKIFE